MKDITTKDLRQFGIGLGVILGIFGGIHFLKGRGSAYPWFWGFAVLATVLGAAAPRMLKGTYRVFIKVTHAIGWFNTRVILVLVYYLLVTPIGLLMRIFGKDPLDRKIDKDTRSYWINRKDTIATKESLEKQF